MTLYHEVTGDGPDLVLLHGWGLHGGFWKGLAGALARTHRVHVLDLPGHGRSAAMNCPESISGLSDLVAGSVDQPATWIGWSLGGLVALDAAIRRPQLVERLVLIGATPRFVQAPDWPTAMGAGVFAGFVDDLARDYRATLNRFLSLQAGADETGRQLIRQLRGEVFVHGDPSPSALRNGLALLEHTDLRAEVPSITAPTLVMHGQHDRLAPPAAGAWLAEHIAHARLVQLEGAGHAPFISHPQQVLAGLQEFLA